MGAWQPARILNRFTPSRTMLKKEAWSRPSRQQAHYICCCPAEASQPQVIAAGSKSANYRIRSCRVRGQHGPAHLVSRQVFKYTKKYCVAIQPALDSPVGLNRGPICAAFSGQGPQTSALSPAYPFGDTEKRLKRPDGLCRFTTLQEVCDAAKTNL